jgi:hypothetical protein
MVSLRRRRSGHTIFHSTRRHRQKRVLGTVQQEALERYQASLDNQLFKAVKELRQLQEWRLKTLETVPVVDDPALQATG